MDQMKNRFPRSVFGVGEEPDPRFTLANERTFLAWNRTALALLAGGVALEALGLDMEPNLRLAASLVLIATGLILAPLSWLEWMRTERALRRSQPLPGAYSSALLAIAVLAVGVLVVLGVIQR